MSSKKTERVGEKRRANNGQMMKIKKYNNSSDMVVEFEDGTIVKNVSYSRFMDGEVKNPNVSIAEYTKKRKKAKDRKGETVLSKSGLKMTIINYINAHNIDVKFEDGIVILEKSYANFKNGDIKHPTLFSNGIHIKSFAYQLNGEWYYECEHPDWTENKILPVKEIAPEPIRTSQNKSKRRIIYGSLLNKTSIASNGMKIKCIKDNGSKDITVEFEDGAIREHQRRESFLQGHIRHPDKNPVCKTDSHIGEVYYDKKGRKMKIVEYFSNSNVTIEYEDGTRLKDKEYRIIKKGADLYPITRVGEKKRARNGLMMEIIDDTLWNNVKIRFEDGVVVDKCTYERFESGAVKHPKYNARTSSQAKSRIGMKKTMKNGLKAEIVEYRNASDIDVLFENGLKTIHRDYESFKDKRIGIPRYVGHLFIKDFAYKTLNDWYYVVSEEGKEDRIMSVKEMYKYGNVDHGEHYNQRK